MGGDKIMSPELWQWVKARADRDYGGDWRPVAVEALERMRAAETSPDPWAEVEAGALHRARNRPDR
ncbi:hypothetical protein Ait01nite_029970 [Actinoplanes italicus]|uniref:Uncharacterized protein n=1 Tax=Actinoplanes italicus TaxID=113567 RepID=A0A2T0KIV4_9ACTN|nr:hypothetical protein [Actinoplanes italicus]PRX23453.1 hypothetical protein CLV67_103201 [Actinoplanes italicus]GIE29952.1 hypothetical protein Ait01nite_029970 [Actinoplanes italicus]